MSWVRAGLLPPGPIARSVSRSYRPCHCPRPILASLPPYRTNSSIASSTPTAPAPKRARRFAIALLILGGVGLATYEVDTHLNASVLQRNIRTAIVGAQIALDYKFNFDAADNAALDALHERAANRLLRVCEANGGLYVKLGQAIGVQAAVLPKPYHALAKMFDDAEHLDYPTVRKVVESELGKSVDEVFVSFDEEPVAAASVAQVHKARLRDSGEEVAVKIQRPTIRAQAKWDLLSFRLLLRFYSHIFDLPLSHFGKYISEQIHKETDFVAELDNATRARKYVQEDPQKLIRDTVYVPFCVDKYCTERLLVMEYIAGATKLTNEKDIKSMGLSVREVSRSVCEVFASQIFQHGFVQCDGHAGNVLVRQHPNGKRGQHQICLIDHGLYVNLSENFRRQYAELWRAIFQLDIKTLERITQAWGMGQGSSELFASATLMRPWKKPKSKEEEQKEREERERNGGRVDYNKQKELIKGFLVHVELVPKELIFVSRSMRIVQANNQVLHSPVNRLNILARHASSALVETSPTPSLIRAFFPRKSQDQIGPLSGRLAIWLRSRMAFLTFRTTLFVLDVAFVGSAVIRVLHKAGVILVSSIKYGPFSIEVKRAASKTAGGFEDDLEAGMRQLAKEEFGVELDETAFTG